MCLHATLFLVKLQDEKLGERRMVLRAVKPEVIEKRLKALFYGNAGVGKTTCGISFPKVYLIDTERGAENSQYIKLLSANGGAIFQTSDFDDVIKEVTSLITEKHDYKTLVIDPLTTLYNDLIDKVSITHGTEFGRHYSETNKRMKHLCNLLLRLDMNVIITSHAKNEYGNNMAILGSTFDCYKKLDYLFDLVFEIQKRGKERIAITKKSRIESIPDGESFAFSYQEIADRYGKEILERDAVPVEMATKEQLQQLQQLIIEHKISPEVKQKWLDKSNSQNLGEMPKESIQKCIDFLLSKSNQSVGV